MFYPTQIQQGYGLAALQGGTGTAATMNAGAGERSPSSTRITTRNALSGAQYILLRYQRWTLPSVSSSGPGPTFTQLNESGGTSLSGISSNSDWNIEEALDIEYVHAMAPPANIILYEAKSQNLPDLDDRGPVRGSQSGRLGRHHELVVPRYQRLHVLQLLLHDSRHKGRDRQERDVRASSGDDGDINESPGKQDDGYPATSPNVVSVGGASLYLNANNSYNYETAWSWNASANNGLGWGGGGGPAPTKPNQAGDRAMEAHIRGTSSLPPRRVPSRIFRWWPIPTRACTFTMQPMAAAGSTG